MADSAEHIHGDGSGCFPGCPAYGIAMAFHGAYGALAPGFGYRAVPWEDVPPQKQRLMVTAAQKLLDDGVIMPGPVARAYADALHAIMSTMKNILQGLGALDRLLCSRRRCCGWTPA